MLACSTTSSRRVGGGRRRVRVRLLGTHRSGGLALPGPMSRSISTNALLDVACGPGWIAHHARAEFHSQRRRWWTSRRRCSRSRVAPSQGRLPPGRRGARCRSTTRHFRHRRDGLPRRTPGEARGLPWRRPTVWLVPRGRVAFPCAASRSCRRVRVCVRRGARHGQHGRRHPEGSAVRSLLRLRNLRGTFARRRIRRADRSPRRT